MDRIIRTPNQIKEKTEGWFLRHEQKGEDQFSGDEVFTLFYKLSPANTTERFINISGAKIEAISYADFNCHLGFVSIRQKQNAASTAVKGIKTEGGFQEFGIKSKSGITTYWTVPTGKPGFSFWNVTNKCEIIGRRFLVKFD